MTASAPRRVPQGPFFGTWESNEPKPPPNDSWPVKTRSPITRSHLKQRRRAQAVSTSLHTFGQSSERHVFSFPLTRSKLDQMRIKMQ